jgi:formylglycine-generating enzyme required for sulfatase activity
MPGFSQAAARPTGRRLTAALLAAAMLLPGAAGRAQQPAGAPWDQSYVDPHPAEGDLVLPMPCGGAMAFRRVEVESGGWLNDMQVMLGGSDPSLGVVDDRRSANIAGAFTPTGDQTRRYYYVGKYEVTRSQYQALAGDCRAPTMQGREPVVDISWFEGLTFAERYTEWLMANARDKLPKEGELSGYLRLPTEAEWEFAARGGMAVSALDFAGDRPPMPEGGPTAYVWFQGSQSAAGRIHPMGLLKPNPLGLYDMLGNASEMMFEPFRLNRRGRLHGQAGGFIIRGGDFLTPLDQIRSATRTELPYFSERSGGATTLRQVGMRLVIAAPAIVSAERLAALQKEYEALPAPDPGQATARQEANAIRDLDTTARTTLDADLRSRLQRISRDLRDAITERNDARDRAVRLMISQGAFFGNKLRTDQLRLDSVGKAIDEVARPALEEMHRRLDGDPNGADTLAKAEQQVATMESQRTSLQAEVKQSLDSYADAVFTVAGDYSPEIIRQQFDLLRTELDARKASDLIPYAALFVKHMESYRQQGKADTEAWMQDLTR